MSAEPVFTPSVSQRLRTVTNELEQIDHLLVSEQLSSEVLSDFRDAVNRVRTTAWAVAQVLESDPDAESANVISLLANERVRVAYRLCRLIDADLANGTLKSGTLVQLYLATRDLSHRLSEVLGRDDDQKAAVRTFANPSTAIGDR